MRTNNSRYMQEVLSTMANYDHELAAKIWNSDAVITVVDNPMQMLEDAMKRRVQPMLAMALVQNMGGASGLTIRPDPRTKDIAPEMLPAQRGHLASLRRHRDGSRARRYHLAEVSRGYPRA